MSNKPIKILIVEDEEVYRDILNEYFSQFYTLIFASNGNEAWKILNSGTYNFHAIITDRKMPRMDGIELLKKIKINSNFINLPVIMQTSASETQEIIEGLEAGAYYYITKPYDRALIMPIIKAAINDYINFQKFEKSTLNYSKSIIMLSQGVFNFKNFEDAEALSISLAHACPNSKGAYVGLSELTYNSIEHGNLEITYDEKSELITTGKYESELLKKLFLENNINKKVELTFKKTDSEISFLLKDEGKGFNWQEYMFFSPERAFDNHGRGIALANKLCFHSINYLGKGNEVLAKIKLT